MNYTKKILFLLSMVLIGIGVSAQTADNVIDNYLEAIGGKKNMAEIKSLYYESTVEVMGMSGNMKTTILNGKGYKQELELMGNPSVTSLSETEGWTINPMAGGNAPVAMTEGEFNDAKNQIFIGAPFIQYKNEGYTAELKGKEEVNGINTVVVKLTSPSNTSSDYYFDTANYLVVKVVQTGEMGETVSTYSDYKELEGYKLPYQINTDINGGQISMKTTVKNASLNLAVDEDIFKQQ